MSAERKGLTPSLTSAGLRRRLKRHVLKAEHRFFAICTPGLEDTLVNEVKGLPGVIAVTPEHGVEFAGPLDLVYQANVRLRAAGRVLMRVAEVRALSNPELYNKARRVAWEQWLGFAPSVAFDITARGSRIHHTDRIEHALYEAIAQVMGRLGVKVKLDKSAPLCVFARIADDVCTLSVDSSGELLHKRGYRLATAKAPIRETTAAALLDVAGWDRYEVIADPLCGSGTFAIEAALMARRMAPGARRAFAFEHWPSFVPGKLERLKRDLGASELARSPVRIVAGDITPGAVAAAGENAERAGVVGDIEFGRADALTFNKDGALGARGLVIANLPYGKRVGNQRSAERFCRDFARRLRESCRGWGVGLVVPAGNTAFVDGLRDLRRFAFVNGGISVEFVTGRVAE